MPSAKTRQTLARQWELLKQLPARGTGKSARELTDALHASGFTVSKRQIERDLNDLMESFPIENEATQTPFRWRWVPGASANIPGLSLAEALSLHLIEETLRPLLPSSVIRAIEPRLHQAKTYLATRRDLPLARWADKVRSVSPMLPMLPPQVDPAVLEHVQTALLQERQLEVTYHSMQAASAKALTLHPLGLIQRGSVTYLLATAFDYDDVRLYALQRMAAAALSPEPSRRLDSFSLDQYVAEGGLEFAGSDQPIRLRIAVNNVVARLLEETPLAPDQTVTTRRGRTIVTARVIESWQLRWWLLSQGDAVEVLQPVALRWEIADTVVRTLGIYAAADIGSD